MVKTHDLLMIIENSLNDLEFDKDNELLSCEASWETNPQRVEVTFLNKDLTQDKYVIKAELIQ